MSGAPRVDRWKLSFYCLHPAAVPRASWGHSVARGHPAWHGDPGTPWCPCAPPGISGAPPGASRLLVPTYAVGTGHQPRCPAALPCFSLAAAMLTTGSELGAVPSFPLRPGGSRGAQLVAAGLRRARRPRPRPRIAPSPRGGAETGRL